MAGRISCCLNLPLLDSNSVQSSSPLLKTTSHISRRRTEDNNDAEPRKRNKTSFALCIATTVVIGATQISDVSSVEAVTPVKEVTPAVPRRWSDERTCQPWLKNSLETIVPENLPRPSAHRRFELAGLGNSNAPPVGAAVVARANKGGCFSV